ncbi:MAG TPA: SDR family NAD(P)-dependent oxidoreductase [Burkholderiales bacterium]|jgi:NAD(P)-dependent dehydrogenase (short-subunit alcohol dehydrogenase family)|nr:SDR family NAD(P)-dependent oxidoreductase [Burkholderiales bacterium]
MALNELAGKVAVVTGAASGLGRAMALAFADEGMHLALADVDDAGLQETRTRLDGKDVKSIVMRLDVSKASEVEAFARKCFQELGAVHVVCNNAGVALSGPVWETSEAEWQWILGVNLLGVVNGVRAFAPRLIAQDEGHIVNTASVAGLISPPGMGAYCVSKHAVVTLSEALHHDLRERGSRVGVSLLCPAYVPTGIADSERNQPPGVSVSSKSNERVAKEAALRKAVAAGKLSADDVARAVVAAVKENRFYVLTHPGIKGAVRARMEDVLEERVPRDPLRLK